MPVPKYRVNLGHLLVHVMTGKRKGKSIMQLKKAI